MLEGFEGGSQTQALLFALFLALYVVAVLGNLTMIVVITLDAHLHSPMYFFLNHPDLSLGNRTSLLHAMDKVWILQPEVRTRTQLSHSTAA